MSKKLNKNQQKNVSGGVHQAMDGTFWLNDQEAQILSQAGYHLEWCGYLPGWEDAEEEGTMLDGEIAYKVNNPQNQRVRDVSELVNVLNNNYNIKV